MDYGRFKYEQAKKAKEAKKHSSTMELKEIKFRPKIEVHDMDFKVKHVRRFLEEGNKCRLGVVFRGREVTHPRTGIAVLDRVVEAVKDIGNVEVRPNLEGKRMAMIVGPRAGVVKRVPRPRAPKPEDPSKPASKPAAAKPADAKPADAPAAAQPAAAQPADATPAETKGESATSAI